MLKKGLKLFGFGHQNQFRVSQMKSWPEILSRVGSSRNVFQHQSWSFFRSTVDLFESAARQKFRQYIWVRSFYRRFFDKNLMLRLREPKYLLCGAAVINKNHLISEESDFDWKKEKISNTESKQYFDHIDQCHEIEKKTITCKICNKRLRIGSEVGTIKYCQCKDSPKSVYGVKNDDCDWIPFIERKDILVWRREHKTMKGNYEYKMYGSFDDVSADEFLSVQLDMSEFRLSWDKNTAQCVVIDKEADDGDTNIVYYWEVNWPRFFSNRDYCCYREHSNDPETGTYLVLSKSVDHPNCPSKKKTWRVQDYFSVLVVKPHTTSDKPGLEFCLTGYENPGLQLPESIITYVAVRGMPEFMINLRAACLKLRERQNPRKEDVGKEGKMYHENHESYQLGQSRMYA